ncbi:MAG TPA: aldose 1-epimerase, partial [Sphingomicrobium sp.]|nr:aldose 1-epimerase [Sphingomicrobium sp.]
MATESPVLLKAGNLRLELSPSIGGAISAFDWVDENASVPILRKCPHPLARVLDAACFPLVPYVNRIRGGEFEFRGRKVRVAPNMAGDPSPLHGQGWLCPWIVERADDRQANLDFHYIAGEWPWNYKARQEFALDENGFSVTLSCRNLGPGAMPCGLGLHPYFPCGPDTLIDTKVTDVWTVDDKVLPVEKVPADGRYDLHDRLVCGQGLDNGFGGWSGEARLTDPSWPYEIHILSSDARFFQLYSPV